MIFKKNSRYDIEVIEVFFKSTTDLIIIGYYNDPHGPRQACGNPCIVNELLLPEDLGSRIQMMYRSCLSFSARDLEGQVSPHEKATGIKSWSKFAKGRKVVHIEWNKNGTIVLELWTWLPSRGFGPDDSIPVRRELLTSSNLYHDLGSTIYSLITGS